MKAAAPMRKPEPVLRSRSSGSSDRPPSLGREMSATLRLMPLIELGYSETEAAAALDMFAIADGQERYASAEAFLSDPANRALVASHLKQPPVPEEPSTAADGDDDGEAEAEPVPMARYESTWGGVAAAGTKVAPAAHGPLDPTSMELVNVLRGGRGSALHRLAQVLTRIEDASHILVWARASDRVDKDSVASITLIELPRLKLRFQPRAQEDGEGVRLYSLDHSGWFISDSHCRVDGALTAAETRHIAQLLLPVPHCLLLEDASANFQVQTPCLVQRWFISDVVL